jgi:hypothetical protein
MNLAKAFEEQASSPILAVTISRPYGDRWGSERPEYVGKLLSWEAARPIIDYEYDNGYGSAGCHAVYAWTETQVIFVSEYDGATGISEVPRNPTAGTPEFSGG